MINIIPGEALINFDVNPDTSTIHSMFPVIPSIVRTVPATKQPTPPIRLMRMMMQSE